MIKKNILSFLLLLHLVLGPMPSIGVTNQNSITKAKQEVPPIEESLSLPLFNIQTSSIQPDKAQKTNAINLDETRNSTDETGAFKISNTYQIGDNESFWLYESNLITDNKDNDNDGETDELGEAFQSLQFTLKYIGNHSLTYVMTGIGFPSTSAQSLSNEFDLKIYPRLVDFFGLPSDVDYNGKINLLIHPMPANVGGYFWSNDLAKRDFNDTEAYAYYSNEAEIIHISTMPSYSLVAHEFQHLLQEARDSDETSWLNEGFSTFSEYIAGFGKSHTLSFRPDVSLTYWDYDSSRAPVSANYGASELFVHYIHQKFGANATKALVFHPKNGIDSVNEVLAQYNSSFAEVFKDFVIATSINNQTAGYGFLESVYPSFYSCFKIEHRKLPVSATENVARWGSDHHQFIGFNGTLEIKFKPHRDTETFSIAIVKDTMREIPQIGFPKRIKNIHSVEKLEFKPFQEELVLKIPGVGTEFERVTFIISSNWGGQGTVSSDFGSVRAVPVVWYDYSAHLINETESPTSTSSIGNSSTSHSTTSSADGGLVELPNLSVISVLAVLVTLRIIKRRQKKRA